MEMAIKYNIVQHTTTGGYSWSMSGRWRWGCQACRCMLPGSLHHTTWVFV